MTILIVDDETEIRESLEEFLSDEGYAVDSAADGAEALDKLNKDKPPCVVILDLLMPLVSGNEVYNKMQQHPRLSKIPVIISTSDPSRAPVGSTVMKKPVNLDHLLGAIRHYCH